MIDPDHIISKNIKAVIFDMDGTLLDSEVYTERSVIQLLRDLELPHDGLDLRRFHGISWALTADLLRELFPALIERDLAAELHHHFHSALVESPPPFIAGARRTLDAVCRHFPTAIVTSSNRESVKLLLDRASLHDRLSFVLSAEDYERSKPDPECYRLAAERLGQAPRQCLVFEDSVAGLRAARGAGARTVAILGDSDPAALEPHADLIIRDYTELQGGFF